MTSPEPTPESRADERGGIEVDPDPADITHDEELRLRAKKRFPGLFSRHSTRLLATVEPWFEAAFARISPPDQITWDIGMQVMPTDQPGQLMGWVWVHGQIPGQVLGQIIMANHLVPPHAITEANVEEFVRGFVESLRESRSQSQEAMLRDAEQAARNGRTPPTGGIILPGQG